MGGYETMTEQIHICCSLNGRYYKSPCYCLCHDRCHRCKKNLDEYRIIVIGVPPNTFCPTCYNYKDNSGGGENSI